MREGMDVITPGDEKAAPGTPSRGTAMTQHMKTLGLGKPPQSEEMQYAILGGIESWPALPVVEVVNTMQ